MFYSRVQEDGQVHGDIIQWAMRVGFRDAGYYVDAKDTQEMLSRVVDELKIAYKDGILVEDNKIHLSVQGRGMTIEEICGYIPIVADNFFSLSNYDGCSSYYPYYPTTDEELTGKFEVMLSTPLSESYIDNFLYAFVENVYHVIRKVYHKLGELILKCSCILFGLLAVYKVLTCKRKKEVSREAEMIIPLIGIMLSGFLLIYEITVFGSFLTIYNFYNYTTGIYVIFSIFEVFVGNHIWMLGKKLQILCDITINMIPGFQGHVFRACTKKHDFGTRKT